MSQRTQPAPSPATGPGTGWRGARKEITIAALFVVSVTVAAWAFDGPAAAGFAAVACAALSLTGLRALIEPHEPPPAAHVSQETGPSLIFFGFWRTRSDLSDAIRSLSAWDNALRPRLANLLAARLAERHGISLSEDPDAARKLLTDGKQGRSDLWAWIDPQRQTPPDAGTRPGIPASVLTALIERLERL
ncbi:MAG TPA: hypothetical protein VHJ18_09590 [Streptosporangiaceae bacterium]|jgi:hypothetical protein|nr:hypothetical protein [Streptosporangiaceae bacterium]